MGLSGRENQDLHVNKWEVTAVPQTFRDRYFEHEMETLTRAQPACFLPQVGSSGKAQHRSPGTLGPLKATETSSLCMRDGGKAIPQQHLDQSGKKLVSTGTAIPGVD